MPHRAATAELLLPEVLAERCVHSLVGQATCQACVDACPARAWVIDDERLGIDEERCDGCGLCAPACPEAAIVDRYAPACYRVEGVQVAFAACDRIESTDPAVQPCLHVLGLKQLLELYDRGIRRLILSRGDCDTCPRGRVTRMDDALARANAVLENRGLPRIQAEFLGAALWSRARRIARGRHRPPPLSRRDLFRRAAHKVVERIERAERSAAGLPPFSAPGQLLRRTGHEQVAVHAPQIKPQRCTGCDACARLCPHEAIRVTPEAYRLDADACTGCGICRDVCTARAIEIRHLQPDPQVLMPLRQSRCRACGAAFHIPAEREGTGELCPTCTSIGLHTRLFQVLD